MSSMMGMKTQRCVGALFRSKSSVKSFSTAGSDSSLTSTSTKTSADRLRRSSSSFFLQNASMSSSVSLQTLSSLQGETSALSSSSSSTSSTTNSKQDEAATTQQQQSIIVSNTNSDADKRTLVQCAVLLAMAMRVPSNLVDEIIEILELHIHSFPILVVLSVLPGILRTKFLSRNIKKMAQSSSSSSTPEVDYAIQHLAHRRGRSDGESSGCLSSSCTLENIQDFYRDYSYQQSDCSDRFDDDTPEELLTPSLVCMVQNNHNNHHDHHYHSSTTDEWGHFADFEEKLDPFFHVHSAKHGIDHSVSRASLSPLQECEEEEE